MDDDTLIDYTFERIISDYRSLYDYINIWLGNNIEYSMVVNLLPFASLVAVEGYDFLVKESYIIPSEELKARMKGIKTIRAKSNKLYYQFKQSTYDSINSFNRDEYEKFFHKTFPNDENVRLTKTIPNYYIAWINNKPINNYHYLSKKIFDCEIGAYVSIVPKVNQYVSNLFSFIYEVLKIFKSDDELAANTRKGVYFKVCYCDLNMAYDYKNFRIAHNPPILMALLDVLCTLNFYNKVFTKINKDFDLDLKLKYITLFYALVSIRDIIKYCNESNYDFAMKNELWEYVTNKETKFVHNKLRRICMHYDFSSFISLDEPYHNAFEQFFNINIAEVSAMFTKEISVLADLLDKAIFKFHIKNKQRNYYA